MARATRRASEDANARRDAANTALRNSAAASKASPSAPKPATPAAAAAPAAARSFPWQINTSRIPIGIRNTFDRLNELEVPEAPTAPTTGTPAQTTGTPAIAARKAPPTTETDRGEIPNLLRNPEHDNLPSAAFGPGQNPAKWQQVRNDEITKATNAGRARVFAGNFAANWSFLTNPVIAADDQSRTPRDYIMSPAREDGTYSKIPNDAPDLIKKEEPSQVLSQNAAIAARKAARIRGSGNRMDPRGSLFR
jgi:hypothetical protein